MYRKIKYRRQPIQQEHLQCENTMTYRMVSSHFLLFLGAEEMRTTPSEFQAFIRKTNRLFFRFKLT